MTDRLISLMYESWADLDRAVAGLTPEEITARHDGGSSIAWTVGHVTNMVDSWLVVRLQGLPPHPVIGRADFRAGGSGGAEDWQAILAGVTEVREAATRFFDSLPEAGLDRRIPYDGSITFLRSVGLSPRYAVMRIAAHHFMHAGEIGAVRGRLGKPVGDFPEWGRSLV